MVGKPRDGYIYSQLRLAKARFKYSPRWCVKNEKGLRAKALADKFARAQSYQVAYIGSGSTDRS